MLTIDEIRELVEGKKLLELHGTIYECVGEKLSGQLIFQDVNSDFALYTCSSQLFCCKDAYAIKNKRYK